MWYDPRGSTCNISDNIDHDKTVSCHFPFQYFTSERGQHHNQRTHHQPVVIPLRGPDRPAASASAPRSGCLPSHHAAAIQDFHFSFRPAMMLRKQTEARLEASLEDILREVRRRNAFFKKLCSDIMDRVETVDDAFARLMRSSYGHQMAAALGEVEEGLLEAISHFSEELRAAIEMYEEPLDHMPSHLALPDPGSLGRSSSSDSYHSTSWEEMRAAAAARHIDLRADGEGEKYKYLAEFEEHSYSDRYADLRLMLLTDERPTGFCIDYMGRPPSPAAAATTSFNSGPEGTSDDGADRLTRLIEFLDDEFMDCYFVLEDISWKLQLEHSSGNYKKVRRH